MPTTTRPIPELTEQDKARFWSKVDKRGESECWPWIAFKNPMGYGRFHLNGKVELANRVAISISGIVLGENICALHNCPTGDNASCCNPAHLWAGTREQNNRDRESKGRGGRACGELNGSRTKPHRVRRLEENGRAKIDRFKADEIRSLRKSGWFLRDLADKFSIHKSTVGHILANRTWVVQ